MPIFLRVILFIGVYSNCFANEDQNLRIGIVPFTQPFVMQSRPNEYYGFDVSTLHYICQHMKKKCTYIPIERNKIHDAIINKEIDMAAGAFVIHSSMQRYFNYSIPYMISEAQFITDDTSGKKPFNPLLVHKKTIGVLSNSVYAARLKSMHLDIKIKYFKNESQIIMALKTHRIDYGFLNHYTALYWQHNSSGKIFCVGQHLPIGHGLGIITAPETNELTTAINAAIFEYQNSRIFKRNFELYLSGGL